MQAPTAPAFDGGDVAADELSDSVLALALQRLYEQQEEQALLDETLAFSLTLDDARLVYDQEATTTDDGKPPPDCSCCLSSLPQPAKRRVMPCGHLYCVKCIATRCKMGVRDRSLVPAHCCKKEFPSEYVKETLSASEWTTYERFVDEKQWVLAGNGLALASDAEYAAAVATHSWKQCPQCGVGVERLSGCNAMRCLRGHHFCYGCGSAPCHCANPTNLGVYGYRG